MIFKRLLNAVPYIKTSYEFFNDYQSDAFYIKIYFILLTHLDDRKEYF